MIHSHHDSRRYHRCRIPTFERGIGGGGSQSGVQMFDPFGSQPFRTSQTMGNQFVNPTANYLGFGGGSSPYGRGEGPYGQFLNQVPGTLSSFLPSMTDLSTKIASGANSAYGGYQNAIDAFMKQLPGFTSSANAATGGASDALGYAKTAAQDAFSPLQSSALYNQAATNALQQARTGEGARGMVEGGQSQAGEQSLLTNLASNTLNTQADRQQAAIGGLTGASGALSSATGNAAGIAGLGPQMASALFSAYPQLASLLTGAAQMPMQAGNQLLSFFQQAMNPGMSLLSMIKPQMGQQSSSWNFNI
jgi:hypothetical protein